MGPDLIVTAVSGPGTAGTGGAITITNTVRNMGMTDIGATFSVGLYLSTEAIITTNDLRIGTRTVAGLGAGQISKTNNALGGNPVQIVIGPDLVVTAVSGAATVPIGGLFDITSTAFNAG